MVDPTEKPIINQIYTSQCLVVKAPIHVHPGIITHRSGCLFLRFRAIGWVCTVPQTLATPAADPDC